MTKQRERRIYKTTTIIRARASVAKARAVRSTEKKTSREAPSEGLAGCTISTMAKEDRSASLRNEIEELREEATALADRAKKTARQAEVLANRIKDLEKKVATHS
jgi:chromosome segregation ATPase